MELRAAGQHPKIPDAVYEAQCIKYEYSQKPYSKLYVQFKLIEEGKYHGLKLFKPYNMPNKGLIAQSSNYYKDFVMVNEWKPPSRNAKMSPKIFLHKIFKVRTRTVKPKRNNEMMPEDCWYSIVDTVLEVISVTKKQ